VCPVDLVQDPGAVGKLVQVQVAAKVQFQEGRSFGGERDVPDWVRMPANTADLLP
jgi:hypothetical protein